MPIRKLSSSSQISGLQAAVGRKEEGDPGTYIRFATCLKSSPMSCPQYIPTKPAWKSGGISPPAAASTGTKASQHSSGHLQPLGHGCEGHWGCLQRLNLSRPQRAAPHTITKTYNPQRLLQYHHPHHLLRTGAGSSLAALHPQSLCRSHLHRRSLHSPPPPLLGLFLKLFDGAKSSLWAAERHEGPQSLSCFPPPSLLLCPLLAGGVGDRSGTGFSGARTVGQDPSTVLVPKHWWTHVHSWTKLHAKLQWKKQKEEAKPHWVILPFDFCPVSIPWALQDPNVTKALGSATKHMSKVRPDRGKIVVRGTSVQGISLLSGTISHLRSNTGKETADLSGLYGPHKHNLKKSHFSLLKHRGY